MAKTIAQKLTNSKQYRSEFNDRLLTESELAELLLFDINIGFDYYNIPTLVKFIKLNHTNWVETWISLKTLHNSTLEYQMLLYGEVDGANRYYDINKRKTVAFNHSPEHQRSAAKKSAIKSKGSKTHSIRSIGYWLSKGFAEEDALLKVKEVQSTNTIAKYIKKYGEELGIEKFNQRNNDWRKTMSNPIIGNKRSLGLWRYIERYGESDGKIKYLKMRRARNENSRMGKASSESLVAFRDIIAIFDVYNVKYYIGIANNKEWFIYDETTERPFFYDLAIPSLSIIIEYHGEAFHPNPAWGETQWNNWRCLFNNSTADAVYKMDTYKKRLAEDTGWSVYEMYSSEVESSQRVIIEQLIKLGYAS